MYTKHSCSHSIPHFRWRRGSSVWNRNRSDTSHVRTVFGDSLFPLKTQPIRVGAPLVITCLQLFVVYVYNLVYYLADYKAWVKKKKKLKAAKERMLAWMM